MKAAPWNYDYYLEVVVEPWNYIYARGCVYTYLAWLWTSASERRDFRLMQIGGGEL